MEQGITAEHLPARDELGLRGDNLDMIENLPGLVSFSGSDCMFTSFRLKFFIGADRNRENTSITANTTSTLSLHPSLTPCDSQFVDIFIETSSLVVGYSAISPGPSLI